MPNFIKDKCRKGRQIWISKNQLFNNSCRILVSIFYQDYFIIYLKFKFNRASCALSGNRTLRVVSAANPGFLLASLYPTHAFGMSPFVYKPSLNYSDVTVPSVFPQDLDTVLIPFSFSLSSLFLLSYLSYVNFFEKIFHKASTTDPMI